MNIAVYMEKIQSTERLKHLDALRGVIGAIIQRSRLGEKGVGTSAELKVTPNKGDGRLLFARKANEYTKQLPPHDSKMIYSSILSVLPSFIEAKNALELDRSEGKHRQRLTESQYDYAIDQTVLFNDAVRDIIDQHHNKIRPDVLLAVISAAAVSYRYSSEERKKLATEAEGVVRGMQHELAFESALYYLPDGFEVLDRDEDSRDDANGKDYRVRCPNGTIVSIDVKASPRSEEKAIQKRDEYFDSKGKVAPRNELILFSGFDSDDFEPKDPWRPKHDAIMRELPRLEMTLLWASGDNRGKTSVSSLA